MGTGSATAGSSLRSRSAMAFVVNPRGEPAVAQHASISFIHPAQVGDVLVADATERMHAGRSGIYDVRVSTEDGELVAEFRGHSRSIRPLPPSPSRKGRG